MHEEEALERERERERSQLLERERQAQEVAAQEMARCRLEELEAMRPPEYHFGTGGAEGYPGVPDVAMAPQGLGGLVSGTLAIAEAAAAEGRVAQLWEQLRLHLEKAIEPERQLFVGHVSPQQQQPQPQSFGIQGGNSAATSGPSGVIGLTTSVSGGLVTACVMIPASKVKDVLGLRGQNVKAVKQRSGCTKIGVVDRSDPAAVNITGSPQSVESACAMVLAIASGDQTCIGNASDSITIDQRFVSKIIGPKGQVISQMKEMSGCYMEVREQGANLPPKIVFTGRVEAWAPGAGRRAPRGAP